MLKRDLNIDKMRIVACIMVIIIHVSSQIFMSYKASTYAWNISCFFDSLSRSAVPIFVMITGILLLNPEKEISIKKLYSKYIPKVIAILFIGSALYSLWYCFGIHLYSFSIKNYIKYILIGPYHFWYFSVIIFLYIITPVIRIITSSSKNNISEYLFWILIVSSIFYTIHDCKFLPCYEYINLFLDKIYYKNILFWGGYYLLGHYIYNTNYLDKYKKPVYLLGIIGLCLCILLTIYSSVKYGVQDVSFYNNFGFPVYIMSVSLIYFMKNLSVKLRYSRIIEILSRRTFGIYIVHLFVLQFLSSKLHIYALNLNIIFLIPFITLLVFIISFIIVSVFVFKT